jgi:hypothetical protein
MATDQLKLYNGALRLIGERKLASLTENIEARYVLDDIWDDELIDTVLEEGQWNFAARMVKLDYAPSITPSFGYQYAFPHPDDFIRTLQIGHDEYIVSPITMYQEEAGVIYCDQQEIYLQYVSNDSQWGGDFSLWPPSFTKWVEAWMALEACPKLTNSEELFARIERAEEQFRKKAKSNDAMQSPARFVPEGRWASWRRGKHSSNRDRGKRSQLHG